MPSGRAEPTTVHVWDFGGQEIYHNTHRLFASEGTVFVIVTTHRDTHTARLDKEIKDRRHETQAMSREEFETQNTYEAWALCSLRLCGKKTGLGFRHNTR